MPAADRSNHVGESQGFVLSRGLEQAAGRPALAANDGSLRLFAELTADPDRLDARPQEAYPALLASLQPGWTVRLLQLFWPDPALRREFVELVSHWEGQPDGEPGTDGRALLKEGLLLHLQESALPFTRRTIVEFVYPGEEGAAWWDGLPGLLAAYGLQFRPLSAEEILELAARVFNLTFD